MSYLRFKFRLSLRETERIFDSFVTITRKSLRIPSYTQLCRRMKSLALAAELFQKRNVTDIVLDTTGLKVYGAGEWRAEKNESREKRESSVNYLFKTTIVSISIAKRLNNSSFS